MSSSTREVTIPKARVDLEDLLALIRQLDAPSRRRVAEALADSEMDARLDELIRQLAAKPDDSGLNDAEIEHEVRAARTAGRSG